MRIRTADGPPQRIFDKGQQHGPGEQAWLIGELRASGERTYYLSNLSADTDLVTLAAIIKARWVCEQKSHRPSQPMRAARRTMSPAMSPWRVRSIRSRETPAAQADRRARVPV